MGFGDERGNQGHRPNVDDNPSLAAHLERARVRREEREAAARRTRLHSFGLAGGRRS